MDRVLTCSCGEKIVVSRSQAGREISCPGCNTMLTVPTLRGLSELPAAETTQVPTPNANTDTWKVRGPILALSFAGILISGLLAARYFYQSKLSRVAFDAVMHIEDEAHSVDLAPPDALLHLWDNYSKTSLGPKRAPDYKLYNDYSNSRFRAGTIASAITVSLLVVATATVFSARKKKTV